MVHSFFSKPYKNQEELYNMVTMHTVIALRLIYSSILLNFADISLNFGFIYSDTTIHIHIQYFIYTLILILHIVKRINLADSGIVGTIKKKELSNWFRNSRLRRHLGQVIYDKSMQFYSMTHQLNPNRWEILRIT